MISPSAKESEVAKSYVEVLVDDIDGSEAVESVQLGWNGQWRQLELSEKNIAALSKAIDRFWDAGRPVASAGARGRRSAGASTGRDPKAIRAWALPNSIRVPSRGRIPGDVERQHNASVRSGR
jgi:hypothetical protein